MDVNQDILDLAINPISDDEPCGINAKYESDYEALEAEIAKSQSLNNESTDWDIVANYCRNILSNISKDFPTACYFAYTLILKDGYPGMLAGYTLLEKMSATYWDKLFPPVKRLRARQNSSQWLIEKTIEYVNANEPKDGDFALIPNLAGTVKDLDFLLSEKMEASAPNFSDLNRTLKRLKEIAKVQAPQPTKIDTPIPPTSVESPIQPAPIAQEEPQNPSLAAATQSIEPVQQISEPTPEIAPTTTQKAKAKAAVDRSPIAEVIGDIQNEQDAKKAFKQAQEALKKLAIFHAQAKASDPKRYRYSRFALWGSLDKLPPAKDGKTQLPAPPADKLKKVIELYEANEYIECIELAEKSADKLPYWFDGNRYIALSLDALGSEYEKAKHALETELMLFIQRVPKIVELHYSNGEPFVSEACKNWLVSLTENSSQDSTNSDGDSLSDAIIAAKKLAITGKLSEAFDLLHEQPNKTKRDKFKIKMACAELACLNGQVKVGIPMLERLIDEVKSLTVADWESDFLSKALALLVNAYEKLDESEAAQKQQMKESAYEQLCWYNPALISN